MGQNFVSEILWGQKNVGRKKHFVKKKLGLKFFWVKKNFVGTFFGSKKCWSEIFWGHKNLGRKFVLAKFHFGLIRFVCVVLLTTAKLNNNNTEFHVVTHP